MEKDKEKEKLVDKSDLVVLFSEYLESCKKHDNIPSKSRYMEERGVFRFSKTTYGID
ncbi:MAG: hypothetical protein PHS34_08615 [Candidatus Omnitrophica bacterium]|nr:hypothetical protein [Candidatus Omnitrophota bacterium]